MYRFGMKTCMTSQGHALFDESGICHFHTKWMQIFSKQCMNAYAPCTFLVIVEKTDGNYSAYSPDLLGCVATGATREETEERMHEATLLHIEGLKEDGIPIPASRSSAIYVAV